MTLQLTNTDGMLVPLQCTTSMEGIWHLGMYISMDRNNTTKIKTLNKRCHMFRKVYQQCPFTQKEVAVVYLTIFLLTITYPFPATNIPQKALEHAQLLTTPTILSKMGFNRNTPKAIVYTPISHGGIGLRNLHNKQGVQQTLQAIKHLCTNTTLGKMIHLTIEAYQMAAGVKDPILKFTNSLPWLPN